MDEDLVTWLRDVLDEDERAISEANSEGRISINRYRRNMQDIEAKRAILDECERTLTYEDHGLALASKILHLLATAYRWRDGYREEWKP